MERRDDAGRNGRVAVERQSETDRHHRVANANVGGSGEGRRA
jgi:hypothetical protein